MEITELFTGFAVVIDDEVENEQANINDLIRQIKDKKIPCFICEELPDMEMIHHFEGVSFLILDWKLQTKALNDAEFDGVRTPGLLSEENINKNIVFLKKLKETVFVPVFIFTNETKESVIDKLKENDLYQDKKPNFIFVKNKDELTGGTKLFNQVEAWVKTVPSIYVLKEWEHGYLSAKNHLFWDFYERSPLWPKVLWDCYKTDGAKNISRELGEIITRNLYTRMAPFTFEETILQTGATSEPSEMRSVLEGERFIKSNQLNKDEIFTGDIFQGDNPGEYWLNIRAQCDLVRDSNPKLYCLKGRIVDESKINRDGGIPFQDGEFREKKNHAVISCIDDGKIIEFLFRDLNISKWNDLKNKRIGRLLPPYITRIQQQYTLYFQRQGLPRTPEEVFSNLGVRVEEKDKPKVELGKKSSLLDSVKGMFNSTPKKL